jgi:hypothetical protein
MPHLGWRKQGPETNCIFYEVRICCDQRRPNSRRQLCPILRHYTLNPVSVAMITIIIQFIQYVQPDQQTTGNANRQSSDINE